MKEEKGNSYYVYLALGIIIGVVIVISSSFIIKWRLSANIKSLDQYSKQHTENKENQISPSKPRRIDMVRDPVCGKLINPKTSLSCEFQNKIFYFCGEICERTFEDEPFRYIDGKINIEINIKTIPSNETKVETETSTSTQETIEKTKEENITPDENINPLPPHPAEPPPPPPPPPNPAKKPPILLPPKEEIKPNEKAPRVNQKINQNQTKTEELKIEEIPLE